MRDILESSQQSVYSPGPVKDEESLLRAVFVPDHINSNGQLINAAIPCDDLFYPNRGFSVQRKQYLCRARFEDLINGYIERNPLNRRLHGIGILNCHDIRTIKDDNEKQALVVIDDAQSTKDQAHAVILVNNETYKRSYVKKLRSRLIQILQIAKTVELG